MEEALGVVEGQSADIAATVTGTHCYSGARIVIPYHCAHGTRLLGHSWYLCGCRAALLEVAAYLR